MKQLGSHRTDFHGNLSIFRIFVEKISSFIDVTQQ